MTDQRRLRVFALVRRELQEYRTSLVWTPLLITVGLAIIMLCSVLLANRISAMGDFLSQLTLQQESTNISIRIDDSGSGEPSYEYHIEQRERPTVPGAGQSPGVPAPAPGITAGASPDGSVTVGSLNPLLNGIHTLFLLILILVCANYLLAALFTDRRDRSILFWKSMPVSEWQEVLTRFGVAMVVAPVLFVAASLLAQVICVLLAMLLLWRMELDPFQKILENLDFGSLLAGQLGGWLLLSVWIAPTYAWLLLASAAARRSPFMTAVAPLIGLLLLEKIVFGSAYLMSVINRHMPHYSGGSAGFYWLGLQDLPAMLLGLLFSGAALWAAVYLRRYRFEI